MAHLGTSSVRYEVALFGPAVYERALLKIVPGVRNSLRQRLSSARRAAGIEIPEDVDETEGGQDDDND